jgi:hypothetical protein
MAITGGQLGFGTRGMSVTFRHNFKAYVRSTKRTQKAYRDKLKQLMAMWAAETTQKAREYCPVYSGNLENAIVSTAPYLFRGTRPTGRVAVRIGVLSDWKSPYDSAFNTDPPWGLSSPDVVSILHEMWEQVAGNKAKARAARKGPGVGSKFLLRAGEESAQNFAKHIHSIKNFSTFLDSDPGGGASEFLDQLRNLPGPDYQGIEDDGSDIPF